MWHSRNQNAASRRDNLRVLRVKNRRGLKLQSLRKFTFFVFLASLLAALSISAPLATVLAEGTRTWEQSKFDDLTKGTATGVAIVSAGGLELAPAFKAVYATPSTYIWALTA